VNRPRGPIKQKSRELVGAIGSLRWTFWYHPRQFAVRWGVWHRKTPEGWVLFREDKREDNMPRAIGPMPEGDIPYPPRVPSKVLLRFKELGEFLSSTLWPGGQAMGEVQFSLRTRMGRICAQLKLADHGGLRVTVEQEDVDSALVALEAALNAQPVPWERDPYPLGGLAKKPKK